ncbi:hypothetical protein PRIC1_000721 [Phytophthora ramorum]
MNSSVPSERTAPTPSSTSSSISRRRSSLSSVTSSGRKRKDQSLLDVAASLGQRTPERSQMSDPTRSRQLDFGGEDTDDVGEETQLPQEDRPKVQQQETMEGDGEEAASRERQQPEAAEDANVAPARPRRGRRETVFWSANEEEFLRQGVVKYGIGKWKKILTDGQDVFSRHRTNVDLKDKWKNLQTPRHTSRKRRRVDGDMTPPSEDTTANETRSSAPVHTVKRRRAISDEINEVSSPESTDTRPRRQAAVAAERAVALIAASEVDTATQRGVVELKFGTDKSFPELDAVAVNLDTCRDVATLKKSLRSSVLVHASTDTDIQFVGMKSRTWYDDNEALSRCIQENGREFFFVLLEEEFV